MKSIEKLRRVAEEQSSPVMCKLVRVYAGKDAMSVSNAEVMEAFGTALDEIERELTECYVELPKDADGNYVHIGDILTNNSGNSIEVSGVNGGSMVFYDTCKGGTQYVSYGRTFLTHYHKDSWERIIEDACRRAIDGYPDKTGEIAMKDLIERCKALAGVEQ